MEFPDKDRLSDPPAPPSFDGKSIAQFIKRRVKGQDRCIDKLVGAYVVHEHKMAARRLGLLAKTQGETVVLAGPTGAGKSEMMLSMAEALDRPVAIVSATSLVEGGYVGEHIESVIYDFIKKCDGDAAWALRGVLYVDEIDKIQTENTGGVRDISGAGVQRSLLTLLGGSPITPRSRDGKEALAPVEPRLFIVLSGAFETLPPIVAERLGASSIGFRGDAALPHAHDRQRLLELATPEDLVKAGFMREFVGRMRNIIVARELDEDDLLEILEESELSVLREHVWLFGLHGIELYVTRGARREIVRLALARGTGARGLSAAFYRVLGDLRYQACELSARGVRRVIIDQSVARGEKRPRLVRGAGSAGIVPTPELVAIRREVARGRSRGNHGKPELRVVGFSDTTGWTHEHYRARMEELLRMINFESTPPTVKLWFEDIIKAKKDQPWIIVKLLEELVGRRPSASIQELYVAHRRSGADNIAACLSYMDFLRHSPCPPPATSRTIVLPKVNGH